MQNVVKMNGNAPNTEGALFQPNGDIKEFSYVFQGEPIFETEKDAPQDVAIESPDEVDSGGLHQAERTMVVMVDKSDPNIWTSNESQNDIVIKQTIPSGSLLGINGEHEFELITPLGDTIPLVEVDKNGIFRVKTAKNDGIVVELPDLIRTTDPPTSVILPMSAGLAQAENTENTEGVIIDVHYTEPVLVNADTAYDVVNASNVDFKKLSPEHDAKSLLEAENAENTEGGKIAKNDDDDTSDMPTDMPVPIAIAEGYEIVMPKEFWEQVKSELKDFDLPDNAQPTDLVNLLVVNRDKLKKVDAAKELAASLEYLQAAAQQRAKAEPKRLKWRKKSLFYGLAILGILGVCAFVFRKKISALWRNRN